MNTYGAARERLIANGYAPASAIAPTERASYRIAEHPAAVLCRPDYDCCALKDFRGRKVVSLIVTARDKALRTKINAVIESLGLAGGPARTGSDGSEHRPLRVDEYAEPVTQSTRFEDLPAGDDPTVILEYAARLGPGQAFISGVIPLAGSWSGGTLLEVPRAKLPAIDQATIERLFDEVGAVLPRTLYRQPPFTPSRSPEPRVPAFRKRDLKGNEVMLKAHAAAVEAGEGIWLPDLEDESA